MPLDGLEALGWVMATFVISLLCRFYQAVYFMWFSIITNFHSAFIASALYWAMALGVLTWYQVLDLIGMYQHVQNLCQLLPLEIPKQIVELPDGIPELPRHEVPVIFLNLPEQPPHYLPHAIPDQDDDVDLDPVLPYMEQEEPIALPSTMWMPTPKPEMVQEVYDALATAEAVATEIELANINTAEFELLF
ncbi:hypothetical protein F5J12DRAFT_900667 [Pisolithus orientalis]|uniref:uncharacterized protein n=1 Tax=Pisolithus orientalis TaxID=936130 RepID=UPI002225090A|nr:uncharacterized protein F5J12DRAFT_900667 [Pisolithus orientalis]KAI5981693.1 hypothetical protein F5J12DRAFT_900667 [Pisolithus orientalis]